MVLDIMRREKKLLLSLLLVPLIFGLVAYLVPGMPGGVWGGGMGSTAVAKVAGAEITRVAHADGMGQVGTLYGEAVR